MNWNSFDTLYFIKARLKSIPKIYIYMVENDMMQVNIKTERKGRNNLMMLRDSYNFPLFS